MITYKTKKTHPGTSPFATIHLNGLLCFSFDRANKCTVAVNNKVDDEHKWKFWIGDPASSQPIVDLNQANAPNLSEIAIEVTGGTTKGTYVYTGSPVLIPGKEYRYNLENHWVDLEGPRGHDRPIKNDANTLWPRFYINAGLFCASKLSVGSFDLTDTNTRPLIKPLGQVPVGIVADIFLHNPKSKIEIKLPQQTVSLKNSSQKYDIVISNDCASSYVGPGQTDFHLHYNAFSDAFHGKYADQFHLVRHGSKLPPTSIKIADEPDSYNDRAPCMGATLGQTSAFRD